MIRWALSMLLAVVAVSCGPAGPVDYSAMRSVGFANGMGDKLNRTKIGTTAFNNSSESVTVPGLSKQVTSTAVRVLDEKVDRVVNLEVPTSPAKFSLLVGPSQDIDVEAFGRDAVAAARGAGLDAVWIVYPATYRVYGARGPGTSGFEHRHDSLLGMAYDHVHFTAAAKLIDARSGETLRIALTGPFAIKKISTEDWRGHWSEVSPARKKVVLDGIREVFEIALRKVMN